MRNQLSPQCMLHFHIWWSRMHECFCDISSHIWESRVCLAGRILLSKTRQFLQLLFILFEQVSWRFTNLQRNRATFVQTWFVRITTSPSACSVDVLNGATIWFVFKPQSSTVNRRISSYKQVSSGRFERFNAARKFEKLARISPYFPCVRRQTNNFWNIIAKHCYDTPFGLKNTLLQHLVQL
jgi:hypothetical protein